MTRILASTEYSPTPFFASRSITSLLHQLCYGYGMGSKQVGESLRERGKAKLKSGGESHLWHRAMAIEKEVCTLFPHQLDHSPSPVSFHSYLRNGLSPGRRGRSTVRFRPLRVIAVTRAPVATVSRLTSRNGLRPVPNELTTASQPFKRNGLSP